MKRHIFTLVLVAVGALGLSGVVACSSTSEATTTEVKLPTMQCGSCEQTISTAVKKVEGVQGIKIDAKTKTATVTFTGDNATVSKIEQAIVKSGYAANDKKADPEAYEKLASCCKVGGH